MLAARTVWISIMVVALLLAGSAGSVQAQNPTNQELLDKMKAMEQRIQTLEGQLEQQKKAAPVPVPAAAPVAAPATAPGTQPLAQTSPPAAAPSKDIFGIAQSPIDGLKLGAYGEVKFGSQQNADHNGQWQTGFDMARLVLLPSFQFTDSIIFNSEIEFEHAGSGFDEDDKLHGTAEVEQLYIDFKVSPYFNIRSPGIDLVPVGYINQHHEPTLFYSVNRPELANRLVPTTWAAPSFGAYGKIVDNLRYQFRSAAASRISAAGSTRARAATARRRSRPATRPASAARRASFSRGRRAATSRSSATIWPTRFAWSTRPRSSLDWRAARACTSRRTRLRATPTPTRAFPSIIRASPCSTVNSATACRGPASKRAASTCRFSSAVRRT
jgi:hypothetical protein